MGGMCIFSQALQILRCGNVGLPNRLNPVLTRSTPTECAASLIDFLSFFYFISSYSCIKFSIDSEILRVVPSHSRTLCSETMFSYKLVESSTPQINSHPRASRCSHAPVCFRVSPLWAVCLFMGRLRGTIHRA